ncbi:MAG: methyltransferase domain-containing protein, partial [Actinobacteria bacterium]|nr:methyltransferase domain-containing protein [Actinomycetota bacterium]
MPEPGDLTLTTYEAAAQRYRERAAPPGVHLVSFLDRLVELVGAGDVLELGSGPGREAGYLEGCGLRVRRTDAAPAFVDMMRADGYQAQLLDVRTGDLGGPYDAVLAHAMLLHLTRQEFHDVVVRIRRAVVDGGVFAFTVKKGDGEGWSEAKLDLPRFFTYWREPAVRTALERSGWAVLSIDHVAGRHEPWLYVLART